MEFYKCEAGGQTQRPKSKILAKNLENPKDFRDKAP